MTRNLVLLVLALAVPARAGERLELRLFGPLAPEHKAFHQDFGGGDPGGLIPKGAHAEAPIEWGLTAGGFLLGLGVSLTTNIIFKNMAEDWQNGGTPAVDAKAGTGLIRVAINAPLVGLAVWGLNQLSEIHSVPYLWPYLAGLLCDLIVFGADVGITAGVAPEAPAAPGGAADGTKVKAFFDTLLLIIGSLAVPLAETIMAQRVRDPPSGDTGGVILGLYEPEELRRPNVGPAWAETATVFSRNF